MPLVACRECGAMISDAAAVCPSCGGPVARPVRERVKDLILILFIVAVVIGSCWVLIDQTIGRAEAARLFAKAFHTRLVLTEETVSVPTDEFRGVLVSVPYDGQVTLEVASLGGQNVDMHLINGADLLRLANAKPPFASLGLNDYPAFEAKATRGTKRANRLSAGSYVIVLEHSSRGMPPSDAGVTARVAP